MAEERSLAEVAAALGLPPDLPHLEEALTHKSRANEARKSYGRAPVAPVDNQRLELLGDAVLGLCVTELLMAKFPHANEGTLSRSRASLVNADALAAWARSVSLGDALRLGKGAEAAGERERTNVLADAVEALVAAAYVDAGMETARAFCERVVAAGLSSLDEVTSAQRDPKSALQEMVQAMGRPSPRYRVVRAEGPDHRRSFVVAVEVDEKPLAEGSGSSKKLAEQEAAREAIRAWQDSFDVKPSEGASE